MVRPEGFEPPAYWFEASCSIQLSYRRIGKYLYIIRLGLPDATEQPLLFPLPVRNKHILIEG